MDTTTDFNILFEFFYPIIYSRWKRSTIKQKDRVAKKKRLQLKSEMKRYGRRRQGKIGVEEEEEKPERG